LKDKQLLELNTKTDVQNNLIETFMKDKINKNETKNAVFLKYLPSTVKKNSKKLA